MKISQIREVIELLNWVRIDVQGGTMDEFKRFDVRARLNPHIAAVNRLDINPRFEKDIEKQLWALELAQRTIDKWKSMQ
jgi:hypothetical protein